MDRTNKAQEANLRLFLSHARRDSKQTERVLRAVTDRCLWETQRGPGATEKAIFTWEGSRVPEFSDFWRSAVMRALTGFDSAGNRARRAIDGLVSDGLVDTSTAERARILVQVLFTPNTIYASIAPDDGGITLYWRAGDMSIEIDIYPTEGYWWRVRNVAAENYSGHGGELPIEALKYSLTWFSKEVDRANPHWRNQAI
jgi:hypothetical protein